MTAGDSARLVLRVALELGVVAALAIWGVHEGSSTGTRIVYGIVAPLVGFGLWGAVDFHQAGRFAEALRLTQELAISGAAAIAAYVAGRQSLGVALAALSLVYHAAVYATGARLLKRA